MQADTRQSRTWHARAIACAALLGIFPAVPAPAAPAGGDLLDACRLSLEQGFDSLEGSLCTWYVTPCDCGTYNATPRVCLPPDPPVRDLAGLVVKGLLEDPALRERPAGESAALILSAVYPCPGATPE